MKAVRFTNYAGDIALETGISIPFVSDTDVLVKIHFSTINKLDLLVYKGYLDKHLLPWSFPYTPGYDFSGVVESVGENVTNLRKGDRVSAINWLSHRPGSENESHGGAFAEFLALPSYKLSVIPPDVSDEAAAAIALVGATAYQALFHLFKLPTNSKILILGGSSAVGAIAIQMAKNNDAWVATTASSRNTSYVSQFGADLILDYSVSKWEEELKDLDFILDAVGDRDAFLRSQLPGVLRKDGKFATVTNPASVNFDSNMFVSVSQKTEVQDALLKLLATKQLKKIPVDEVFPFTQDGVRAIYAKQEANKSNDPILDVWTSLKDVSRKNLSFNVLHSDALTFLLPQKMKAARFNEYNGPIVLESQVPVPSIGDEDALVKITYATINPLDLLVYKGYFRQLSPWSFPYIPGYDFAGVVESVGSKVTGLKVGERVTAISWRSDKPGSENDSHGGTFAEYLSIPAYKLSIIPPDVSDQEAAALVLVGPTAFQALFHLIKLPRNSRVLILGGSSAVGAVAIQLAKQKGAWVATTASPRNTAFVSQFGADVIIDYTSKKWEEEVKDIDAVFDAVGDKDSYIRSQLPGVLKEGGKYGTVANGAAVNYNPNLFIGMVQIKEVQDELLDLLAKKQLKIPIDTVFPFTQEGIRDIFAKQEANKANGKNLLHVA